MRYPQLIICGPDGWVANQLADLATEHRWLVKSVRRPAAALELVREPRPSVLLVQADPQADDPEPFQLIADAHRIAPAVPTVVIGDGKLPEEERAVWTAALFDLGCRFMLFPPLTRTVLEDVVSGLMAAAIRRSGTEVES